MIILSLLLPDSGRGVGAQLIRVNFPRASVDLTKFSFGIMLNGQYIWRREKIRTGEIKGGSPQTNLEKSQFRFSHGLPPFSSLYPFFIHSPAVEGMGLPRGIFPTAGDQFDRAEPPNGNGQF
jgi:hypothetical protein